MLLIADSGSTKCDWVLFTEKGKEPIRIKTKGLNPSILDEKSISETIRESADLSYFMKDITSVYFFGAGCNTSETIERMEKNLTNSFSKAKIVVKEDTMAAVMATSEGAAVVCIIGTGSNCCYYDGKNIQLKVPALGYVFMDEASGNYFGKELLKAYYYNKMPKDLKKSFEKEFSLGENEVINNLYQSETPNKYLAEFAPFLFKNKKHKLIDEIIKEGVSKFIDNSVLQYKEELKTAPLYFVGSVAYYAQDYIISALNERGLRASRFVKNPISNVINKIVNESFLASNDLII